MKGAQSVSLYVCTACRQQAARHVSRRAFSTKTQLRADDEQQPTTTTQSVRSASSSATEAGNVRSSIADSSQAAAASRPGSDAPSSQSPDSLSSSPAPATFRSRRPPVADTGSRPFGNALTSQRTSRRSSREGRSDILDMLEGQIDPSDLNPDASTTTRPTGPHRLYVYTHKHNTHLTLTQASRLAVDTVSSEITRANASAKDRTKEVDTLMSMSTGNIGFRKAGRGTYDAAFQLGAYFLKQMRERGMLKDLKALEIVLRGFGPGREAMQKLLLGAEGRAVRDRITCVMDATRLKIGGCRSPKPRRL